MMSNNFPGWIDIYDKLKVADNGQGKCWAAVGRSGLVPSITRGHVDFTPDDRLDSGFGSLVVELDRPEHISVVGDGHGWVARMAAFIQKASCLNGPVQKTELRMDMKMNKG